MKGLEENCENQQILTGVELANSAAYNDFSGLAVFKRI